MICPGIGGRIGPEYAFRPIRLFRGHITRADGSMAKTIITSVVMNSIARPVDFMTGSEYAYTVAT